LQALSTLCCLDLDALISERMEVQVVGGARQWACLACFKVSALKTDIARHVEATHIHHPGFHCQVCGKTCKTRDALRCHMNKYHK